MKQILFFCLLSTICAAEQTNSFGSEEKSQTFVELEKAQLRQHMLREKSFLTKKYQDAMQKLQNWQARKEELLQEFEKNNTENLANSQQNDEYEKLRTQKRKREFHRSLEKEETHVTERVVDAEQKLRALENEFAYHFGIMTREENSTTKVENRAPEISQEINSSQVKVSEEIVDHNHSLVLQDTVKSTDPISQE